MTIAALKKLLERTTPGPWKLQTIKVSMEGSYPIEADWETIAGPNMEYVTLDDPNGHNAAAAVALRNAAPALIACAETLREYLEWGAMTGSDRELFRCKFEACLKTLEKVAL